MCEIYDVALILKWLETLCYSGGWVENDPGNFPDFWTNGLQTLACRPDPVLPFSFSGVSCGLHSTGEGMKPSTVAPRGLC